MGIELYAVYETLLEFKKSATIFLTKVISLVIVNTFSGIEGHDD